MPDLQPRITISMSKAGMLEIFLNETGRDILIMALQRLSPDDDHIDLAPEGADMGVPIQLIPYHQGDALIDWAKILYRPDSWDAVHYPHVLQSDQPFDRPR